MVHPSRPLAKMAEKVDKEGYYKYLLERDKNKGKSLAQKFMKGFLYVCQMTGLHRFKTIDKVEDTRKTVDVWRCETCGYECTEYAFKIEIAKIIGGLAFLIAFPIWFFLSPSMLPPVLDETVGWLWLFFLLTHVCGSIRAIMEPKD